MAHKCLKTIVERETGAEIKVELGKILGLIHNSVKHIRHVGS